MAYDFLSLDNPAAGQNKIGLAEYCGFAPIDFFTAIAVPGAFSAPGDEVLIKTAHTFAVGKGFSKLLLAPDQQSLEAEAQGDKGSENFKLTLKVMRVGLTPENLEWFANAQGQPAIVVVPDSDCKTWYQLGTNMIFAYLRAGFSTGTTKDGKKGIVGTIEFSYHKPFIYQVSGGPTFLT